MGGREFFIYLLQQKSISGHARQKTRKHDQNIARKQESTVQTADTSNARDGCHAAETPNMCKPKCKMHKLQAMPSPNR